MKHFIRGFGAGGAVATLAGLIGLGGAEFRLPILKGLFRLDTLKAVILNKATSLIVVFFALIFRSYEIPFEQIWEYKSIIFNLLLGSLAGAWIAAGVAMKIDEQTLDRIVLMLLLFLAAVLMLEHWFLQERDGVLFDSLLIEIIVGIVVGFGIGIVASMLGVAGGELLIPTIVLLYGVDVKLAGSLSLAISLPTMLVGFVRYTKSQAFIVLREERSLFIALSIGSIVGAAVGSALLGVFSGDVMVMLLALVLMISAYKIFSHQKKANTKGVADKEFDEENHHHYKDIMYIEGSYQGHNTRYPIVLSVNPCSEKVFAISRGWGHGETVDKLSLDELVSKNFIDMFNHQKSQKIYEKIIALHQKKVDDKSVASELLKEFENHVCHIALEKNECIDDSLGEIEGIKK